MAGGIPIKGRLVAFLMIGGPFTLGWESETGSAERTNANIGRRRQMGRVYSQLRMLVSTVSFWTAIVLPVLYLPLLLGGVERVGGLELLLGLIGLHMLALLGGGRHRG